jgi:threonine/homoserine/homoserine lactone efflux protein
MPPLVNGLFFGLIFVFAIGPSFFLLIQNSIEYGFKRGAFIALGISLSDILFVSLTLFGMAAIFSAPENSVMFSVVAAIILLIFGVYSFVRKPKIQTEASLVDGHSVYKFLAKGFLINIFNPTIILFWITLSSTVSANYNYNWTEKRNFFLGLLITILVSDLTKAYLANHVRSLITVKSVRIFNRLVGSALVIFAFSLIFKAGTQA